MKNAYQNKRILITGGLGFIGLNLIKKLMPFETEISVISRSLPMSSIDWLDEIRNDKKIRVFQGDIRDRYLMRDLLGNTDIVFNLAARSGAAKSLENAHDDMLTNIDGHLNLLETIRQQKNRPKVVYVSSRLVYGVTGNEKIGEDFLPHPTSIYGLHKLTAEHYYRLYSLHHGIPSVILRLTNPYGPFQKAETKDYGIVNHFIMQAINNEEITLYGEGNQLRDYIYIDDAVDAILKSAIEKSLPQHSAFNLGYGQSVSIRELAESVVKIAGTGSVKRVEWPSSAQKVETGDFIVDVSKIENDLNWKAKTSLKDGLNSSLDFYRKTLGLKQASVSIPGKHSGKNKNKTDRVYI